MANKQRKAEIAREEIEKKILLLFVGSVTSQQHASVSQGWVSSILRAATLRQKLQIKLSISSSHSIWTQGRPVPALTLYRQASGRVAATVSFL